MSVKETLAHLVSIDSVSARSNAEIISYLEDRCRALGFSVRRYPYKDAAGIEKVNLVCIAGDNSSNAAEVELVFVRHSIAVSDPN